MVEISCFYMHYYHDPVNITFIKYEKFMKIILQKRKIVISIENLKKSQLLYQFYILSLLTTEDCSKVSRHNVYGVSTEKFWMYLSFANNYDVVLFEKDFMKNPLLSQEPKKETSVKKQNKFFKMLYFYYDSKHIRDPIYYIEKYLSLLVERLNMDEIIQYENKIYILSCIRGVNKDVYSTIKKFL
jgi:hypothetical protein